MNALSEVRSAKGREAEVSDQRSEVTEQAAQTRNSKLENRQFHVALLTGGGDKPYALGIAEALTSAGNIRGFHRQRRFERAGVARQSREFNFVICGAISDQAQAPLQRR